MAIIFFEVVEAAAGLDTLRCRAGSQASNAKDIIVGACHRTSDGQDVAEPGHRLAMQRISLWALAIALATGKNET